MSNPVFLFSAAAAVLLALAFVIVPLLGSRQRSVLIGALIFVPATALVVYLVVGNPAAVDPDTGQTGQIRSAVTDLATQAMREPDNAEHWARLGLAYKSLEEFSSAEHAFRRALYIDSDVPFLKAELAETLLYASGERELPDEAHRLFVESADSGNQKALWFLGLDAFQREAYPAAIKRFERLLAVLPEQSDDRETVERYLATARARGSETPADQTVESAITELNRQAMREPDNAEHWARLGLAYKSLEEFSSAEHAFRRALDIDRDDPFLKTELAETLLYASGNPELSEEARRLLKEAADSDNQKALWLLGLDAFQREVYPAAAEHFERLLALLPEQSSVRNTVERYLATARAGGPGSQTQEPAQQDAGPSLSVSVSITGELAQELDGDETVFVAVRAATGGPPLAARRLQADQFPLELAIDDDDAMMAGGGLSSADSIVVVARVSFSGDAAPRPGDFEGRTDILSINKNNMDVEVTIDRVL